MKAVESTPKRENKDIYSLQQNSIGAKANIIHRRLYESSNNSLNLATLILDALLTILKKVNKKE